MECRFMKLAYLRNGRSRAHGQTLTIPNAYIIKSMPASPSGVAHGRGTVTLRPVVTTLVTRVMVVMLITTPQGVVRGS